MVILGKTVGGERGGGGGGGSSTLTLILQMTFESATRNADERLFKGLLLLIITKPHHRHLTSQAQLNS